MTKHTEECKQEQERFVRANRVIRIRRYLYALRWPRFCRLCEGAGFYWGGIDEFGQPNMDPCRCTGDEPVVCARCGEAGLDDETGEGPCSSCGWDYNDPLPPYDEWHGPCGCELDEWAAEAVGADSW